MRDWCRGCSPLFCSVPFNLACGAPNEEGDRACVRPVFKVLFYRKNPVGLRVSVARTMCTATASSICLEIEKKKKKRRADVYAPHFRCVCFSFRRRTCVVWFMPAFLSFPLLCRSLCLSLKVLTCSFWLVCSCVPSLPFPLSVLCPLSCLLCRCVCLLFLRETNKHSVLLL